MYGAYIVQGYNIWYIFILILTTSGWRTFLPMKSSLVDGHLYKSKNKWSCTDIFIWWLPFGWVEFLRCKGSLQRLKLTRCCLEVYGFHTCLKWNDIQKHLKKPGECNSCAAMNINTVGLYQPKVNLPMSLWPKLSGGGPEAREWASCHQSPYLCDPPISPTVYKQQMLAVGNYWFLGTAGHLLK